MRLWHGRPMAFIGSAAICAALCGYYLVAWAKLWIAAALAALLLAALILRLTKSISARRAVTCVLAAGAALVVLWRAFCYFDVRYSDVSALCGEEHAFVAEVTAVHSTSGYGTSYETEVLSVDGREERFGAMLYCEYAADHKVGHTVYFKATPTLPEKSATYDSELRYLAKGMFLDLTIESESACTTLAEQASDPIKAYMSELRMRLAFLLSDSVGGEEGALASAMLLGYRDGVNDATERDLSRAGVSHLLALSGLHLSILVGSVGLFLDKVRMPKLAKVMLLCAFIIFYLLLTGAARSTVRAAVMTVLVFAAYWFGTSGDGVSSVFFAATLILSVSPAAILDAGFLLSFSATLGITAFVPEYERWSQARLKAWAEEISERTMRVIRAAFSTLGALLTCLAANCLTLVIIWHVFGRFPLAAPISNLLVTPLAGLLLTLSLLCLIFSAILPPIGGVFALAVKLLARCALNICAAISDIRGIVMSLEYDFVPYIIIAFTAVMLLLLGVKLRHKLVCVLPSVAAVAAFVVCFSLSGGLYADVPKTADVISRDGDEAIVITSCGSTVLIDIGNGSYGTLYAALAKAESDGATEVEALVLTHYHMRHISSVTRLLTSEKVRRVWLPYPETYDDAGIMARIFEIASKEGAECAIYRSGEAMLCFGDVRISSDGIVRLPRSTHPVIRLTVDSGAGRLDYIGASAWEAKTVSAVSEADTVIFGAHGPKIKSASTLLPGENVREILLVGDAAARAFVVGMGEDRLASIANVDTVLFPDDREDKNGVMLFKQSIARNMR